MTERKLFTSRSWLAGFAVLALAAGGTWLYSGYRSFLERPMHTDDQSRVVELPAGTSFSGMVAQLKSRGLTEHPWFWRFLAWRRDASERLQAGEYRVDPGMRPGQFLDAVVNGRVIQHSFTIVEGWTFDEMLKALSGESNLLHATEGLEAKQVMARLGHPDQHPEGRFLPETYHFPRGTEDLAVLERAYNAMQRALESAWSSRDTGLPYDDPREVLILASIIEKETAVPEERARIAGVFVRRLERGMRLQTDPTVIYGLGENYNGNLRRSDLEADNPYNTYTRGGLPPTPICMPGRASLEAAVHPEPGSALYFVSKGDGTHVFSDTLAEHNRAVARYQLNYQSDPK